MISSLTSRFKFADRRALFIGARDAAVYHWPALGLAAPRLFDLSDEGREAFRRYLAQTPKAPFHILLDVPEEEYRHEVVPHVSRRRRAALLRRKAGRLFKNTPYCHHRVTGRETEGRRDDRALLTAIVNPAALKPWSAMLDEAKTPLAAVGSLPLFTQSLLKVIAGDGAANQLIVSLQSLSGLRQTFFRNGAFRLSRLVQMPSHGDPPATATALREEVEKICRYLVSARLAAPEEPVDIYFLASGKLLDELRQEAPPPGNARQHFRDLAQLRQSGAGARTGLEESFSDSFFMQQALKRRPANIYATPRERRYLFMRRLRGGLLTAGALLLAAGAAQGGLNLAKGLLYQHRSRTAAAQADSYAAQYEEARRRLPETPVEPAELKVAIDIAAALARRKTGPGGAVRLLSDSLGRFPAVQATRLVWSAAAETMPGGLGPGAARPQPGAVAPDLPPRCCQARLEGRIEPFDGDFRAAMAVINRFANDLRSQSATHSVRLLALPLNLSPDADLQGDTRGLKDEARFTMDIVYADPDGEARS